MIPMALSCSDVVWHIRQECILDSNDKDLSFAMLITQFLNELSIQKANIHRSDRGVEVV